MVIRCEVEKVRKNKLVISFSQRLVVNVDITEAVLCKKCLTEIIE